MTTPANMPVNAGGLIGNLLGGAAGSLGGTNNLQQSLDALNNSVTRLTTQLASANIGGGGTIGQATRQQGAGTTNPFPRMINPFQQNNQQAGIGGGGPGGAGNVSAPTPFGRSGLAMMASAVTQFGQNQMNPLLTLNQYATSSMLGMNTNGMGRNQAMNMLYSQAGMTPGSLNMLASSPQDAIASMQTLQQLAGTMNIRGTNLGRAGLGAQAAFGLTNPTLGAQASSQLAAALYSPQFSQNMMALGYSPIRSMIPGGAPMNSGQAAQSILRGLGLQGMKPNQLYGNLASGRAQASLSALFGSSGINNQQAMQFLEGYNQLFSKGLNANQATQLFSQAASGNLNQAKAAQSRLNQLGVATSANDIQALKNSQAVTTGREGLYASGFDSAIQSSTGLLEKFNTVLSSILKSTGAGGALGFAGGFGGVLSGTSHAVGSLGTLGGLMAMGRMLGLGGGGAGGAGGLLGRLLGGGGAAAEGAGGAAAGGAAGLSAALGPAAAGLGGVLAGRGLLSLLSKAGVGGKALASLVGVLVPGMGKNLPLSLNPVTDAKAAMSNVTGAISSIGRLFGGAAGAPQASTSQQRTGGNNQLGGISGSAKSAVSAAESQVGVPYLWGGEQPGVGFDCSGLIQWAYKQAGINLPRTSQQMWSSMSKRRVPLNQVQEGDLIFSAGSDGTSSAPGHVGMMINGNRLIQAPYTGANVQIVGYNPGQWLYAARPSGRGSFVSGGPGSSQLNAAGSTTGLVGNRGLSIGGSGGNQYGSANEADLIAAMGMSGGRGYTGGGIGNTNGSSGSSNKITGRSGGSGSTSIPTSASGIVAMAKRMAAQYNWASGMQWEDFVKVVNAESGWRVNATNSASGAYGIPQALPGSKMASAGPDWQSNPATQLKWMFGYIKGRYGSPAGAWAHEQQYNWYGTGGMVQPGLSIVGDRGPELMMTTGGRSQIFSNSQTMALINSIKGNTPQNPWKTDITAGSDYHKSYSNPLNINFNAGSIVIHSSGATNSANASKAGREVARQVVRHLDSEAIHTAIRNGDKL